MTMTPKKRTQLIITIIAALLGIAHLAFPSLKIDVVFVSFLLVAVIPWLEPLFKSVELPGGLKVEYKDFQKVENEAKKAGLIKEDIKGNGHGENSNYDTTVFEQFIN